jgi:putative membrane protein
MQDPVFLLTAGSSNLLEIQTAQLALQKSTSPEVKKFAQMMLDHHTKATQELKGVATPLSVALPEVMMPIHQAIADKVKATEGKKFDETYMDAMETAHQMDVAMFETKSRTATDPTVKAFATKTLPMLKSHAAMATEIEDKVD